MSRYEPSARFFSCRFIMWVFPCLAAFLDYNGGDYLNGVRLLQCFTSFTETMYSAGYLYETVLKNEDEIVEHTRKHRKHFVFRILWACIGFLIFAIYSTPVYYFAAASLLSVYLDNVLVHNQGLHFKEVIKRRREEAVQSEHNDAQRERSQIAQPAVIRPSPEMEVRLLRKVVKEYQEEIRILKEREKTYLIARDGEAQSIKLNQVD